MTSPEPPIVPLLALGPAPPSAPGPRAHHARRPLAAAAPRMSSSTLGCALGRAVVGLALVMLASAALPARGLAQPTVVKLATLVPDGSVWHKVLLDQGEAWTRETQGRATLRIYPGGVAGDEPDMVRKMRIGQIQAAALTVMGLSDIDNAFAVFGIPMFFDSNEELLAVLQRLEPVFKQRLEAKGFVLLNWGHAGWVYFFTKQPVQSVAELKKTKIFVWAGDDRMIQMWKASGYQPVALAATDILPGLQTGMIDALPTTPLASLSLQWFRQTPNMSDLPLGPLVGATVITRQAWNKFSEADRAKMLAASKKTETKLLTEIPNQDKSAVVEMQKRGLKVIAVSAAGAAEWRAAASGFAAKMRGDVVPADILDLAIKERDAFRQRAASKKAP